MPRTLVRPMMVLVAALWAATVLAPSAKAQGTAFTYQGRLDASGGPTSGLHDFRFTLYTSATGGVVIASPVCVDDVDVVDGVFTVLLDFGPVFTAPFERHLEVAVRQNTGLGCSDLTGYETLSPRQQITATPLALHATSAYALDAADGVPTNAVYVDADGKVGIGTTTPTKQLHIRSVEPTIALQDLASASNQSGYISFRNDASVETAWIGFGTAGSPHFSIVNARAGGSISIEALTVTSAGLVGVGTTSPVAKLDVRGDVRLGASGQYYAPSAEENLRIVRGRITSTGAISVGSGFTVSRTGAGLYVITFSTPFAGTPVLTLSPAVGATGGPYNAHTNGVTTVSAGIRIVTGSGTNIDDSFDFIAIGPR